MISVPHPVMNDYVAILVSREIFEEREYIIKPDTVTITDKMTWQEAVEKTGINVFQS